MAGGNSIRCAPYATFGSKELADLAVQALHDRMACLLGNHGQLTWHTSLARAYELAAEVESLSAMYFHALQLGEPRILDDAEMRRVLEKFRDYRSL